MSPYRTVDDPSEVSRIVRGQSSSALIQIICGLRALDGGARVLVVWRFDGPESVRVSLPHETAIDAARTEIDNRVPR